jgi:hypothetical protein
MQVETVIGLSKLPLIESLPADSPSFKYRLLLLVINNFLLTGNWCVFFSGNLALFSEGGIIVATSLLIGVILKLRLIRL